LLVNDLHRHVMNLAVVLSHPKTGPRLIRRLRRLPAVHPTVLAYAQDRCKQIDAKLAATKPDTPIGQIVEDQVEWAENYFVCAWMSRAGSAGTKGEFEGS